MCQDEERTNNKSSTGKPGNPPAQCTKTQISLCRKSQGLISFNNRRAEGLCTNQWVHSGKHTGTQLETGRYEGEESRARKPVADLVQGGNGGMGRWKEEGDGNARQKWAHAKIITEDDNGHGHHSEHVNKTAFYIWESFKRWCFLPKAIDSKRSEVAASAGVFICIFSTGAHSALHSTGKHSALMWCSYFLSRPWENNLHFHLGKKNMSFCHQTSRKSIYLVHI